MLCALNDALAGYADKGEIKKKWIDLRDRVFSNLIHAGFLNAKMGVTLLNNTAKNMQDSRTEKWPSTLYIHQGNEQALFYFKDVWKDMTKIVIKDRYFPARTIEIVQLTPGASRARVPLYLFIFACSRLPSSGEVGCIRSLGPGIYGGIIYSSASPRSSNERPIPICKHGISIWACHAKSRDL